jgi:hypothetical protein
VRDLGALWHALGGAAIAICALLIGIPVWLVVATLALGGWLREVVQHDLPLSRWQWIEAACWPLGALSGIGFMLWLRA